MITIERRVPYSGNTLKQKLLETRIDKGTGKIISIRKWLQQYGDEFQIAISNYNYWCKKDEVKSSLPYRGKVVTDELVYRYGLDQGWIKADVTVEQFKEDRLEFIDRDRVIKLLCEKLDWMYSDCFTAVEIEDTLIDVFGKDYIMTRKTECELELERENGKN